MSGATSGGPTRLGMVRCEHCQRQFNPHSAARHIPWCKKQQNEAKKRRLTADKLEALERYRWRIGYRPANGIVLRTSLVQRGNFNQELGRQEENARQLVNQNRPRASNNKGLNSSSINSSATLSSPTASSTTSLSTSNSNSTSGQNYANQSGRHRRPPSRQVSMDARASGESRPEAIQVSSSGGVKSNFSDKLKRSASSMTLTKQRSNGSASSRNSRISTTTTCLGTIESRVAQNQQRTSQMRAKSVSDLTCVGEIVETLARRLEEIYAQNQLLLEAMTRARLGSSQKQQGGRRDDRTRGVDSSDISDEEEEDDEVDDAEFAQCHHCRAQCSIEANYCHKCGCKMRPSNPTPPSPG